MNNLPILMQVGNSYINTSKLVSITPYQNGSLVGLDGCSDEFGNKFLTFNTQPKEIAKIYNTAIGKNLDLTI